MKLIVIILSIVSTLLLCVSSYADGLCNEKSENLGAIYSVKNTLLTDTVPKTEKNISKATSFQLWRKGSDILHIESSKQLAVLRHKLANGKVRQVNYFDQYQRGIEFEPKKLTTQHWVNSYQLIANEQLDKMTLLNTEGEKCEVVKHYRLTNGDTLIELWWQPAIKLAKKIIYQNKNQSSVWELDKTTFSSNDINNMFNKRQNYQMTDYADIGDNESDPFLRKMIHLGFIEHSSSGFYDANSNQLSNHHH